MGYRGSEGGEGELEEREVVGESVPFSLAENEKERGRYLQIGWEK